MRDSRLIEDLRLLSPPDHQWILWVLVLGLLTVLAWRWWHRTRASAGTPTSEVVDPLLVAWEEAMRELERLGARLEPEHSRRYGIEVTDVLRRYVERRFGLRAPRLTTLEFLEWVRQDGHMGHAQGEGLGRFLGACDWMKFGRAVAGGDELRGMHGDAVAFVLETRPRSAGEVGEPAEASGRTLAGREGVRR